MRYAAKKSATQYDLIGRLKCDRCGKPLSPWFLRRPDVCSGADVCIRMEEPVLNGWARERAKQGRVRSLTPVQPVSSIHEVPLLHAQAVEGVFQFSHGRHDGIS